MPPDSSSQVPQAQPDVVQGLISIAQAIKASQSKTVDSNGWTVYDFGNFKEYKKTGFTATLAANGYGDSATVNLPVGVTDVSCFESFAIKNGSGQVIGDIKYMSSSTIKVQFHSTAGATLTPIATVTLTSI